MEYNRIQFEGVCETHVILTPARVKWGSEQHFVPPLPRDLRDQQDLWDRLANLGRLDLAAIYFNFCLVRRKFVSNLSNMQPTQGGS